MKGPCALEEQKREYIVQNGYGASNMQFPKMGNDASKKKIKDVVDYTPSIFLAIQDCFFQ